MTKHPMTVLQLNSEACTLFASLSDSMPSTSAWASLAAMTTWRRLMVMAMTQASRVTSFVLAKKAQGREDLRRAVTTVVGI